MSQDTTQSIFETLASNYTTVAFITILLYDHALTLADEIEFIWKQSMSTGKILFLLNRYIPEIDLFILMNSYTNEAIHSEKVCLLWFQIDSWLGIFNVVVIDLIMLLRTWALWRRSRIVLVILSTLLVLCICAAAGATLYASIAVVHEPSPGNLRPCETGFPRTEILYGLWVAIIVYDTAIVILLLVKAIPALRLNVPIIDQLLKDGIQYFVMILFTSIANVIVINAAPPALATMLFTFYRVMTATLGSRMVLNIRGTLLKPGYNDEE
ncbi:hypothetical protein SERLA73DRAFT_188957, partial [Serpula lacrymans var. lacrymans S7.3]